MSKKRRELRMIDPAHIYTKCLEVIKDDPDSKDAKATAKILLSLLSSVMHPYSISEIKDCSGEVQDLVLNAVLYFLDYGITDDLVVVCTQIFFLCPDMERMAKSRAEIMKLAVAKMQENLRE